MFLVYPSTHAAAFDPNRIAGICIIFAPAGIGIVSQKGGAPGWCYAVDVEVIIAGIYIVCTLAGVDAAPGHPTHTALSEE